MPPSAGARPKDWYSLLGVAPEATTEQIVAAVERLGRQANALAVTAPERAQQLRDHARAIKHDLLSGEETRQRYDRGLAARAASGADSPLTGYSPGQAMPPPGYPSMAPTGPAAPAPAARTPASPPGPAIQGAAMVPPRTSPQSPGSQVPGLMSRISKFLQTGWTCAGCGYGAQPTDKFCPKCGNRIESGLGGPLPRVSAAGQANEGPPGQVPEAEAARCDKCGSRVAPGDAFCMRCGGRLSPAISGN